MNRRSMLVLAVVLLALPVFAAEQEVPIVDPGQIEVPRFVVPDIHVTTPFDVEKGLQHVDCDHGQSLGAALKKIAVPMTVEVTGTCHESAVIRIPDLTLVGVEGATIIPPEGYPAISIIGADRVTIRNLTLTGATIHAVQALNSTGLVLENMTIVDNHAPVGKGEHDTPAIASAVLLDGSEATILGSVMNRNDGPVLAYRGSMAVIKNSEANDNPRWGFDAELASRIELYSSIALQNGLLFIVGFHSSFETWDSDLETDLSVPVPNISVSHFLWDESSARFENSVLRASTTIAVEMASSVLVGNSQVYADLSVQHNSALMVVSFGGGSSLIQGNIVAITLSNVEVLFSPMSGAIVCGTRSHAMTLGLPHPIPVIGCD